MLELYLQHNFYNVIFKIKQIIYSFRVSAHNNPPTIKNSGYAGMHLISCTTQNLDTQGLSLCPVPHSKLVQHK
jgi:hypothetical protein